MNNKKLKTAFILNIIIFVFVVFSVIAMFTDFEFMAEDEILSSAGFKMLRYYTVDSNILMGITALVSLIWQYLVLSGKKESLPKFIYIFKLIGTVGVTLTFLVVVFFLAPTQKNLVLMFCNANLFMHLLTPILSMVCFIFFEKTDTLKFKESILGVSSMVVYGIYYTLNVILHSENGEVSGKYDFYGFLFGKLINAIYVMPLILLVTFGISYLLVVLNKTKKQKNKVEK